MQSLVHEAIWMPSPDNPEDTLTVFCDRDVWEEIVDLYEEPGDDYE